MSTLRNLNLLCRRMPWKRCFYKGERKIYSPASLGIYSFAMKRKKFLDGVKDIKGLKVRLNQFCEDKSSILFMDDVRKMLGVVETDEDLELLFRVLKRYMTQKEVLSFDSYNFGPDLLRLLHYMQKPAEALSMVHDEDLLPCFQYYSSSVLLLDLLFKNKMYENVLEVGELFMEKCTSSQDLRSIPHAFALLYVAACYNLNTPEHFIKACGLFKKYKATKKPWFRVTLFLAALSVKQNEPFAALEVLIMWNRVSLAKNLKCMALAQAQRFSDVLSILDTVLDGGTGVDGDTVLDSGADLDGGTDLDGGNMKKDFLTQETLSFVEEKIRNNLEYTQEFDKIKNKLMEAGAIRHELLDELLHEPVDWIRKQPNSYESRNKKTMTYSRSMVF